MVPVIHSHGERRKPEEKHLSTSPCQTAVNMVVVRENREDQVWKRKVLGLGVCVCCVYGMSVYLCVCKRAVYFLAE